MNRPPLWFERKFDFTFPVEQHPNLCVRLRGTPARLEEIVRRAAREVLVRKPGRPRNMLGTCWTSNLSGQRGSMTT
jgi:hypothetical protein